MVSARQQRGVGWMLVQRNWLDNERNEADVAAFLTSQPGSNNLAEAFEKSMAQADETADRLRRETQRVSQKANLLSQRVQRQRRLDQVRPQLAKAEEQYRQDQQEWQQRWTTLGIQPDSPKEMRAWLRRRDALVDFGRRIRETARIREELIRQIDALRSELTQCLVQLGEPAAPDDIRLSELERQGTVLLAHLDEVVQQRKTYQRDLARLEGESKLAQQRAQEANRKLTAWTSQWGPAMQRLRLRENAMPQEANTVISLGTELFNKFKEAEVSRDRLDKIDRDARRFCDQVRSLAQKIDPDLAGQPPEHAAAELNNRREATLAAKSRMEELVEQRDKQQVRRRKAELRIRELKAVISGLCQEAGCDVPDELVRASQRSGERRRHEQEKLDCENRLLELAGSMPLDEFVTKASETDPDETSASAQRLEMEIEDLRGQSAELSEAIGGEQTTLCAMDGTSRAADVEAEVQSLLAVMRSDAEEFVRLRLASMLLRDAIEDYRERNQGPVLLRASDLFADMTLGSFAGLRMDYDESGKAVLMGVRADGTTTIGVKGMSDGTCDQLYLALRIASLETYLQNHEPIPFIVDDILIQFDDDRSVAAIKALAGLSESTQVILFSHHDHLVRLAETSLDSDVLYTHSLQEAGIGAVPLHDRR